MPSIDGLDVELVEEFEADAVVCTGLFDDEADTPEDYADLLMRLALAEPALHLRQSRHRRGTRRQADLVRRGAGARLYAAGRTHADCRQAARADLRSRAEGGTAKCSAANWRVPRFWASATACMTDVKGAADNGIDVLYISGGIHSRDYGDTLSPDPVKLGFLPRQAWLSPVATMPRLR